MLERFERPPADRWDSIGAEVLCSFNERLNGLSLHALARVAANELVVRRMQSVPVR
jgi:hypothetical protein